MERVIIQHWRYEDGIGRTMRPGWYCWAYEVLNSQFSIDKWMKKNMVGKYDCDFRFNSGDPMYTIYIKEQRDAEYFALNFVT